MRDHTSVLAKQRIGRQATAAVVILNPGSGCCSRPGIPMDARRSSGR